VIVACEDPPIDTGSCRPCAGDGDCAFSGNPCTATVYCAHVDTPIAVIDLGCSAALERRWPDDERCACVAGACGYVE
jgi:hypothetical protein